MREKDLPQWATQYFRRNAVRPRAYQFKWLENWYATKTVPNRAKLAPEA
ncbi:MAG: hypothetical protein RMJ07_03870 [Nitrososphaerota archaeon]|nr:hypothetical protein [Candidatus Bathyarchaeota archaeon]MDW8048801.1 hypothetical protein [Nitrososphaerota archaeon]